MSHVFGCLLLAEITGRAPVTHWGLNSLYGDGSDSDAFRLYFEPVSPFSREDLRGAASVFPAARNLRLSPLAFLDRPEIVAVSDFYVHPPDLLPFLPVAHPWRGRPREEVYRLIAAKRLRLRPAIADEIEAFHREHLTGPPVIAVHFRGTDKFHEAPDAPGLDAYFSHVDREAADWRIFLLTDQAQAVDAFRARYGARVIVTQARRSHDASPVHLGRKEDRVRLGIEIIKDVYLALRCQKFVGLGMSNPSVMIAALRNWAAGDCRLLGPSLLDMRFIRP